MKKLIASVICIGVATLVQAQQAPQFTQFMQAGNLLNPAFTGISRNADVKIGYRKQWAGLTGAPSTFFASGSTLLGLAEPTISLPVRGRLSSQFKTEKPEVKDGLKHGVGGFLLVDKAGPASRNLAGFTYAANMPLNEKFKGSFGAGLMFSQTSLNRGELNISPERDPGIGTGINSAVRPNFSLGFMVYSDNLFLGYSGNYLLRNKIYSLSDNSTLVAKENIHHYGFLGYRKEFGSQWAFVPSIMFKYVQGAPVGLDLNCRFNYGSKAWFGAAFRPQDAFSGFAGIHISDLLSLAYSYDYNYSQLNAFNNGSHEIILGMRLVRNGAKLFKPGMW